jgi:hypothetical protein
MARDFKSSDKGKQVLTADGDMVGTVDRIKGGKAHVKPDDSLSKSTRRKLGWTDEGEDMYALKKSKVDKIDDAGIHLKRNL